ncbi:hypothetical protein [Dechloromonas denitrificans]|uniref:hypothetical protein n=1 Tax=Dechloromonas denitrificans TaxID=281362 RepID=UPI001CF7ED3E|nr:hypothetical protein [Dechloromonas denitrificans]UCV02322.1 hypothetical protein KI611_14650 [Dechloromonas denitrificans]
MNDSRLVKLDRILNDARMAADDIAGTLENLAVLYAELSVARHGGGGEEKRMAATFSTIHAQAVRVVNLLDEILG